MYIVQSEMLQMLFAGKKIVHKIQARKKWKKK